MFEKIAIVIMIKRENKNSYSSHINLEYAKKYEYDFFIEHCIDDENKLLICTKYLSNYHYVLFITDSNIIFKNDIKLETIIDKYISNKQVIALSSDWNENFMKSKILLIKNCLLSFEILNYWNNYADIIDELNIAYEMYTDNMTLIKFDIFENVENLWFNYFYSNEFISKNVIFIGLITSILFGKFIIKF